MMVSTATYAGNGYANKEDNQHMTAFVDQAFTVRKPAWWDVTGDRNFEDYPKDVTEVRTRSGTDWEPRQSPLFKVAESHKCDSKTGCSALAVAKVQGKFYACGRHANHAKSKRLKVEALPLKQVTDHLAVWRDDTGGDLGVSSAGYELYGNRETVELLEILLDSKVPEVKVETGGSLKGGKLIWYLARLEDPMEIPGDNSPIYPYVSILNSHDGSAALRAIRTSVRIVCWNTWSAAEREGEKTGQVFSFRHTASIRDRIEDARKVLFDAKEETAAYVEYATKMIAVPITQEHVRKFLIDFVPMPPADAVTDRVANNVHEARKAIERFYHSPSCVTTAGTALGLIHAAGEYLDHGRAYRTPETYVSRTYMKPEAGKLKAMRLVEELVGVGA
jgi:phage/plasmid-like protein (TIGR03299 family)